MEDSSIFFHALAYIAFIVLSGISFLVCFILFVIRISQNHAHKWNWLIGTVLTLLMLLFSIYLFVSKVVNAVKDIGHHVEQQFERSMEDLSKMDSSYQYSKMNSNEMVKQLMKFDSINGETNIPKEFYVYYGFADYYRMPITYPYSIHCTDVLETGTLFNERKVTEFNVNDNGEDEWVGGIKEFAFDNSTIIVKARTDEANKEAFFIYKLGSDKMSNCSTLKEAFKMAHKEYGYQGPDTLISILQYNQLFK